MDEQTVVDAHTLLHPIRYKLVQLINAKPSYQSELAAILGMGRRLATYHLDILEEAGFLTAQYRVSQEGRGKGRAQKVYSVSPKVAATLAALKEV